MHHSSTDGLAASYRDSLRNSLYHDAATALAWAAMAEYSGAMPANTFLRQLASQFQRQARVLVAPVDPAQEELPF